jgi:hypothetical protein
MHLSSNQPKLKMFVVITPGGSGDAMICIPNTCNDLHLIISTFLVRLFRVPGIGEEGLLISYHSKEQGYARGNLPFCR